MKRIRCFSILLFAFAALRAGAQTATPGEAVQRMFTALKTDDPKTYMQLYPTAEQTERLMRTLMQQAFQSPAAKKAIAQSEKGKGTSVDSFVKSEVRMMTNPEAVAKRQEAQRQSYNTVREQGQHKGVQWQEADLISFTLDSSLREGDRQMKDMKALGIKRVKGVVDFRSAGQEFQLSFYNLTYVPAEGGWFANGFTEVIRKDQEKFSPEKMETKEIELSNIVDDVPPPPPPPAKVKTKTKTTAIKTKTKTKS